MDSKQKSPEGQTPDLVLVFIQGSKSESTLNTSTSLWCHIQASPFWPLVLHVLAL